MEHVWMCLVSGAIVGILVFLISRNIKSKKELGKLKERQQALNEINEQMQELAHHQRLETIGTLTSKAVVIPYHQDLYAQLIPQHLLHKVTGSHLGHLMGKVEHTHIVHPHLAQQCYALLYAIQRRHITATEHLAGR